MDSWKPSLRRTKVHDKVKTCVFVHLLSDIPQQVSMHLKHLKTLLCSMPPHNSKDAKCTQRTKYMSAPQAVVVQLATLGKLHTCVPYIPFTDFNLESMARHKQIAKVAIANWLLGSTTWGADKLAVPICTCGHRDLPNAWHLQLLPFTKSQSFSQILSELLQLCYPTQAERSRHRPSQIDSYSLQSWQTNPQTPQAEGA